MSLLVLTRRDEIRAYIREKKIQKASIGFVPTMGALHRGHTTLIDQSVSENDVTVVSIFVNPTQFGPKEDLSKYPRTFEKDFLACQEHGVDVLFAPTIDEMYPSGFGTKVQVEKITEFLCGKYRPGHFEGVATVVLLLLNLVQPNKSYFGQKDFQQVQVITRMALDLACEPHIIMVPTIREKDGLALSSRNAFLDESARMLAQCVPKSLAAAAKCYLNGERSVSILIKNALQLLTENHLNPQYLELRSYTNLAHEFTTTVDQPAVLAIAQFIPSGNSMVRLIDNIILSEDSRQKQILNELLDSLL